VGTAAIAIAIFFVIGVAFGVAAVVAASAVRRERGRWAPPDDVPGYGPGGPGELPPGSGRDDPESGDRGKPGLPG
jgi:hypothetical protein